MGCPLRAEPPQLNIQTKRGRECEFAASGHYRNLALHRQPAIEVQKPFWKVENAIQNLVAHISAHGP